ncbi:helicase-related protein [Pontibacillus yanchengensis]|uniref:helicase-related protein n=1 Tax=Pontibacillus yanchengensis TaxID=462910 RepID=UPI001F2A3667|nr:helicase-related protein [Pontibacillus yanchengensis]
MNLENSLSNRDKVHSNVKEEIIGPSQIRTHYKEFNPVGTSIFENKDEFYEPHYWIVGGEKEEVLQRETPSQRYVSGMLYPLKTSSADETSLESPIHKENEEISQEGEDLEVDQITNADDEESSEDHGEVELLPQSNDFMPSTMGLTFCVDKNVPNLQVKIEGGTYTPHSVYLKGESQKTQKWWLRETIQGFWNLDIEDLWKNKEKKHNVSLKNKKDQDISHLDIHFQGRIREINNKYIITISVTNRTKDNGKFNLQQLILFQSKVSISTPDNYSFSFYPKDYQMKNDMSDEEASTELLYKNEYVYAFGHGCSTHWEQNQEVIQEISSTFMPEYESLSMTPNIYIKEGNKKVELEIKMSDLAGLSSDKGPGEILQPLIKGYGDWIKEKEAELGSIPLPLKPAAERHIKLCKESLERINKGLELLEDKKALKAFKLANLAILLQQRNGKVIRDGKVENGNIIFDKDISDNVEDEQSLKYADNTWRAFQIAFILMSMESLINEKSKAREIVDLIWFPTGGGKTEAYLGVAAFQMIYRRLKDPYDSGVDVLMRYTLRLLTADQFQRSSRLICALEYIRKTKGQLGETPFSIGIWVGSKTTPNKNNQAKTELEKLRKQSKDCQEFIVNNCPWCGAKMGYYSEERSKKKHYFGYKAGNNELVLHCPDSNCMYNDELPIYLVDETIYKKRPTFLIGTIDKFVQLVWKPEARSLFGLGKNGERVVSPPSLIVQDELHLISGPLGTLAGLFETLIEELCLKNIDGETIKPKIISATATINQFNEQALALFGRENARLFPSPGLDNKDSFFAKPAYYDETETKPMPGRKYVGVYTQKVRIMMSQVMTFSSILQASSEIERTERDPYWTLLTFYNTLRELGGGLTLTQTDIPQYSNAMAKRKGMSKDIRYINNYLELTSRKQSHEISKTIDDLKVSYKPEQSKKDKEVIDLCLASNIIEVGVDIDRLSVMAIVGQPKMTAQYIQVSGRVGRKWSERPGLVFTLYANTKSRDKSHFEHFREYHQRLYSQVEPTSVTPFSDSCLDKGLEAVLIGFLRQALNQYIAYTPDWREIEKFMSEKIVPFYNRLVKRVELVDKEQVDEFKSRFKKILKNIELGSYNSWEVDKEVEGYMYSAGKNIPPALKKNSSPMINSLRNVDAECRGLIVSLYQSMEEDSQSSSWEDLLS